MTLKVVSLFCVLFTRKSAEAVYSRLQAMRSSRGVPGLTVWSE